MRVVAALLCLALLVAVSEAQSPLSVLHLTTSLKSQHAISRDITRLESQVAPLSPEAMLRSEMDGVEKVEEDFFCIGCVWDHMCRKR